MSRVQWHPSFNTSQEETLKELATTYALSHGLCYLPTNFTTPPTSSIHAPISLIPSPFPKDQFLKAFHVQSLYNTLYARVAMDWNFLDKHLGKGSGVGDSDSFTLGLWNAWKSVRDRSTQRMQLGLFRSDYLLHNPNPSTSTPTTTWDSLEIKQVEFNTISSSFGPLSDAVSSMHRYLLKATNYFGFLDGTGDERLPVTHSTKVLGEGIRQAHVYYNSPKSKILFVIQDNERNVFDQRMLEYELTERHGITVVRRTMTELLTCTRLRHGTKELIITAGEQGEEVEISVIYFRATYTPTDFPSEAHWNLRAMLEESKAIKCPSLPLQLAGSKKVQQVLTDPGVLEHFLSDLPSSSLSELRSTWMGMWDLSSPPLSQPVPLPSGIDRVLQNNAYEHLVLKPQREGGGNNIYRSKIPDFLKSMPEGERKAWIVMELIQGPGEEEVKGVVMRDGQTRKGGVVSELGVFGWCVFGKDEKDKELITHDQSAPKDETRGWLLRTKGRDVDEGGVASGWAVLDSVALV